MRLATVQSEKCIMKGKATREAKIITDDNFPSKPRANYFQAVSYRIKATPGIV